MIDSEQSLCAAHTNFLGFEDDLLRWRALRSMLMLETFADHELRKLLFGRLLRCRCGDHLASAHNSHPVSDLIDLSKLMGYENYRFPLFFQPSNHVKQLVGLLRRQERRRFIQNQNVCMAIQKLDNLYTLLHPDRELINSFCRIQVKTIEVGQFQYLLLRLFLVKTETSFCNFLSKRHIFCNAHIWDQHQFLMYHADAVCNCIGRITQMYRFSVYTKRSFIRLHKTVDCFHKCALSCTIFPKQGMNFPFSQHKVHMVIGQDTGTISLCNSQCFQYGGLPFRLHDSCSLLSDISW